jgi:hypothetical protein
VPGVDLVQFLPPQHRRRLDQQQPGAPRHRHGSEEGVAALRQRLQRRQILRRDALNLLRDRCGFRLHHRLEQRLLVGEVMVQRPAGDAGRSHQFRRSRLGIATLDEQPARGRDERGLRPVRAIPVGPAVLPLHTCSLYVNYKETCSLHVATSRGRNP